MAGSNLRPCMSPKAQLAAGAPSLRAPGTSFSRQRIADKKHLTTTAKNSLSAWVLSLSYRTPETAAALLIGREIEAERLYFPK